MNKLLIALAMALVGSASYAQTSTAVKESGKAIAEKAMEGKEATQAAVTTDATKKAKHKAKAKAHKAKSEVADEKAKAAGDKIGK